MLRTLPEAPAMKYTDYSLPVNNPLDIKANGAEVQISSPPRYSHNPSQSISKITINHGLLYRQVQLHCLAFVRFCDSQDHSKRQREMCPRMYHRRRPWHLFYAWWWTWNKQLIFDIPYQAACIDYCNTTCTCRPDTCIKDCTAAGYDVCLHMVVNVEQAADIWHSLAGWLSKSLWCNLSMQCVCQQEEAASNEDAVILAMGSWYETETRIPTKVSVHSLLLFKKRNQLYHCKGPAWFSVDLLLPCASWR
jgi:hypothetical protein